MSYQFDKHPWPTGPAVRLALHVEENLPRHLEAVSVSFLHMRTAYYALVKERCQRGGKGLKNCSRSILAMAVPRHH